MAAPRAAAQARIRLHGTPRSTDSEALQRALDREVNALDRLDTAWADIAEHAGGTEGRAALREREAAALTAMGRWVSIAALAREESRGMHRRQDRPAEDPRWRRRVILEGIDRPTLRRPGSEGAASRGAGTATTKGTRP